MADLSGTRERVERESREREREGGIRKGRRVVEGKRRVMGRERSRRKQRRGWRR